MDTETLALLEEIDEIRRLAGMPKLDEVSRRSFMKGAAAGAAGAAAGAMPGKAEAGGLFLGEKMKDIKRGMSAAQVEEIIGREPDGFDTDERGRDALFWTGFITGWSWDQATYMVVFVDDKVVAVKTHSQ